MGSEGTSRVNDERLAMRTLPTEFLRVIAVFAPVVAKPVGQHVNVLLTGAVLAPGRRTVTTVLTSRGLCAEPHVQT